MYVRKRLVTFSPNILWRSGLSNNRYNFKNLSKDCHHTVYTIITLSYRYASNKSLDSTTAVGGTTQPSAIRHFLIFSAPL